MLGIMFTDMVRVLKARLWLPAFGNLNYKQRTVSPGGGGRRVRQQQEGTCRLRARWERSCTKHRPGLVGERMGTLTAEAVDQLRLDAVRAEPWRAQGAHEGLGH